MHQLPYFGETCALAAPLAWSIAVILFRVTGRVVPAVVLNLVKSLIAITLFTGTLLWLQVRTPEWIDGSDYALLLVSGAIGVAASDTLFFMCLNRLGAGLQAIVSTAYSPSIIFLSILFLGERLNWMQWLGVALIIVAVLSVVWMRGPRLEIGRRTLLLGALFGVLGSVTQAISVVMIKPLLGELAAEAGDDPRIAIGLLVWATSWRLAGGTAAAIALLPLVPSIKEKLSSLRERRIWPVMISATIVGTFLSLILWMAGFMWAKASVASALNQTATLFTFVLAAIFLREAVTLLRLAGLLLGVGGVALLTFFG
jgi:drug/metabolite transporter (DMT)-like permease